MPPGLALSILDPVSLKGWLPNEFRRNLTREPVARADSKQRPSIGPEICDRPCFRKIRAGNVRLPAASFLLHLSTLCIEANVGRLTKKILNLPNL